MQNDLWLIYRHCNLWLRENQGFLYYGPGFPRLKLRGAFKAEKSPEQLQKGHDVVGFKIAVKCWNGFNVRYDLCHFGTRLSVRLDVTNEQELCDIRNAWTTNLRSDVRLGLGLGVGRGAWGLGLGLGAGADESNKLLRPRLHGCVFHPAAQPYWQEMVSATDEMAQRDCGTRCGTLQFHFNKTP